MSNIDTGTALRHVLEQNGYTVLLGVDGAEGVDIYDRQRKAIDLVVLDMSMPRMSGDKALQQLCSANPGLRCYSIPGT